MVSQHNFNLNRFKAILIWQMSYLYLTPTVTSALKKCWAAVLETKTIRKKEEENQIQAGLPRAAQQDSLLIPQLILILHQIIHSSCNSQSINQSQLVSSIHTSSICVAWPKLNSDHQCPSLLPAAVVLLRTAGRCSHSGNHMQGARSLFNAELHSTFSRHRFPGLADTVLTPLVFGSDNFCRVFVSLLKTRQRSVREQTSSTPSYALRTERALHQATVRPERLCVLQGCCVWLWPSWRMWPFPADWVQTVAAHCCGCVDLTIASLMCTSSLWGFMCPIQTFRPLGGLKKKKKKFH